MHERTPFDVDRQTNYIDRITPSKHDFLKPDGYNVTFLWKLQDGRNIYLYLFLNYVLDENHQPYTLARVNVDSSEVRGQGIYLGLFVTDFLTSVAQKGYEKLPAQKVKHVVEPNQYSKYLVANNPDYLKDGTTYVHFFHP